MTRSATIDLRPLPRRDRTGFAVAIVVAAVAYADVFPIPHHAVLIVGISLFVAAVALYRPRANVPVPTGGVFRGRIESKLGPFALQVVDNELRACPFVVRLNDGRVALVDDAALVLEANEDSLGVGSEVELTGNPTLTPYAPEGYRGASALRFQGEYGAPVGIRALG